MKIVKAKAWHLEDVSRNHLPECGHQAQVRFPFLHKHPFELRRLHAPSENRQVMRPGKFRHEQFFIARVRIFSELDIGMNKRLCEVVGRNPDHAHQFSQWRFQQFAQDVVAAVEAAEHSHTSPGFRSVA
jgi:hypothetical protein